MKKTVAVICSRDTKQLEQDFAAAYIESRGYRSLKIDISSRYSNYDRADVTPLEIVQVAGFSEEYYKLAKPKSEAIEMVRSGLQELLPKLYSQGAFQAVLGMGGVQNTLIASNAMQQLPLGVPKVILSTVTSGNRKFAPIVGAMDIVVIPSIADIAGLNPLTELMIRNACGAVLGMLETESPAFAPAMPLVGATIMGANSAGIEEAIQFVKKAGHQVVTFHSTGVGGTVLESLISSGVITACLDLSLHEIVSQDVFGDGFSVGAENRLGAAAKTNIPLVFSPSGLDFIDFYSKEFLAGVIGDPKLRHFTYHNNDIVHVKLTVDEAARAAQIVVNRLATYKGEGVMVIPLRGLRSETLPGENLYAPEIDQVIFNIFREELNPRIQILEVDAHISDRIFSETAANELLRLLNEGSDADT